MCDFLIKSKKEIKNYIANIQLKPMPKNCFECPFFFLRHEELKDTWEEDYECFLTPILDWTGIAIWRYHDCPLERKENAD